MTIITPRDYFRGYIYKMHGYVKGDNLPARFTGLRIVHVGE